MQGRTCSAEAARRRDQWQQNATAHRLWEHKSTHAACATTVQCNFLHSNTMAALVWKHLSQYGDLDIHQQITACSAACVRMQWLSKPITEQQLSSPTTKQRLGNLETEQRLGSPKTEQRCNNPKTEQRLGHTKTEQRLSKPKTFRWSAACSTSSGSPSQKPEQQLIKPKQSRFYQQHQTEQRAIITLAWQAHKQSNTNTLQ